MIHEIDKPQNKERYAIVSVGYNRLKSQRRLLSSLLKADYSGYDEVPLVVSIDCSGDEELYAFINDFKWPYGDKYVIIRDHRLGLKDHILACGDLTNYFKGIILLEDDLYVSKEFYNYTIKADEAYGCCDSIASISLYNNEMNGYCWLPLVRLKNNSDVFADQSVSTWGEAWNRRMWRDFRTWLASTNIPWDDIDMPLQIKQWTRAWSKFFNAYLVLNNKYSIFPYTSLTTNFSDAGEHGNANNTIVQVSLQQNRMDYRMLPFDLLVKYDIYSNNMDIPSYLGLSADDVCVDMYGVRPNSLRKRYYLTVRRLPYKVVRSFGLYMRPQELNIFEDIPGDDIYLYDTHEKCQRPRKKDGVTQRMLYYLHGFSYKYMGHVCWGNFCNLCNKVFEKVVKKVKHFFSK